MNYPPLTTTTKVLLSGWVVDGNQICGFDIAVYLPGTLNLRLSSPHSGPGGTCGVRNMNLSNKKKVDRRRGVLLIRVSPPDFQEVRDTVKPQKAQKSDCLQARGHYSRPSRAARLCSQVPA